MSSVSLFTQDCYVRGDEVELPTLTLILALALALALALTLFCANVVLLLLVYAGLLRGDEVEFLGGVFDGPSHAGRGPQRHLQVCIAKAESK